MDLENMNTNKQIQQKLLSKCFQNALAGILLLSLAAVCTAIAQEPLKDLRNRSPSEIQVSKGIVPRVESESVGARQQTSGWLNFDKCLVFAGESIELPSQESGSIASLEVRENESISPKQVIAKLDVEIAKLEKEAALLQSRVAASEALDPSDVRLAQAFVEETKMQAEQYEEMAAKGSASPTEYRQRQLAAKQAEARLVQSNAAKQQRELKAQLAQSAVFLCQQKLDRLTLRSPIAGTVTRIDHRAGEWIQTGTTIVKIVRLDEVRIDCFITDDQVDRAELIDKPVKVTLKRWAFIARSQACTFG